MWRVWRVWMRGAWFVKGGKGGRTGGKGYSHFGLGFPQVLLGVR